VSRGGADSRTAHHEGAGHVDLSTKSCQRFAERVGRVRSDAECRVVAGEAKELFQQFAELVGFRSDGSKFTTERLVAPRPKVSEDSRSRVARRKKSDVQLREGHGEGDGH
jgi:hypothetical protein